jgi:hypothetical protein
MQAFSLTRPQQTAVPVADRYRQGTTRRVVTHRQDDVGDHPVAPRQVSGAVQPAMRELSASPVLTFPGGMARPAPVATQTGAAVTGGAGQILDAGRARGAGQTTG